MQNSNLPSSANPDEKFSIGRAAKYLGVSIDTLRRWEKSSKIHSLRSPGGHRYFLRRNLDAAFGQKYQRTPVDSSIDRQKVQSPVEVTQLPPINKPTTASTETPQQETPIEPLTPLSSATYEQDEQPIPSPSPSTTPLESIPRPYRVETIEEYEEPASSKPLPQNTPPEAPVIPSIPQPARQEVPKPSVPSSNEESGTLVPSTTVTTEKPKRKGFKKAALYLFISFVVINFIMILIYIFISGQL